MGDESEEIYEQDRADDLRAEALRREKVVPYTDEDIAAHVANERNCQYPSSAGPR